MRTEILFKFSQHTEMKYFLKKRLLNGNTLPSTIHYIMMTHRFFSMKPDLHVTPKQTNLTNETPLPHPPDFYYRM